MNLNSVWLPCDVLTRAPSLYCEGRAPLMAEAEVGLMSLLLQAWIQNEALADPGGLAPLAPKIFSKSIMQFSGNFKGSMGPQGPLDPLVPPLFMPFLRTSSVWIVKLCNIYSLPSQKNELYIPKICCILQEQKTTPIFFFKKRIRTLVEWPHLCIPFFQLDVQNISDATIIFSLSPLLTSFAL